MKLELERIETLLKDLIDYIFSKFKIEHCSKINLHPAFNLNYIYHMFFEGKYDYLIKKLDDKLFFNLKQVVDYVDDS